MLLFGGNCYRALAKMADVIKDPATKGQSFFPVSLKGWFWYTIQ